MELQPRNGLATKGGSLASNHDTDVENVLVPNAANGLQRRLKARHVQMIAIGSNVGTGLFIGSGKALHTGGPLALVLAFLMIAASLACMMQCLGEMAVIFPVSGSFTRYATRFLDEAIGFAMGWQYWLCWVSVFGAESSAFVILINFWNDDPTLTPLWISIFILISLLIHLCPVAVFGEVEFIVSTIKVTAIIVFLIVTWAIIAGAGSNGQSHGVEYWQLEGLSSGLHNGFKGLASVFVLAAFAAGGVEMVGVVAGEASMPKWTLPRAIRTLMYRIAIFYILSMVSLSFVVAYNSPELIGGSDANSSPFVIAIREAGIRVLPDILNAVVMICVCSVGSTGIYIGSRTLQAMAEDGFVWKIFARTDNHGRPFVALIFTGAVGMTMAYLNVSSTGATVFGWFAAISGMAFFIAWLVIIACNWRFHAAIKAQGDNVLNQSLAFRAMWWPWLSIFAFITISFMVICQLIVSVSPINEQSSATTFFSNFIGVPIFIVMWAGYKITYKTKLQELERIDLQTGRLDADADEIAKFETYTAMSRGKRAMSYLHM